MDGFAFFDHKKYCLAVNLIFTGNAFLHKRIIGFPGKRSIHSFLRSVQIVQREEGGI